MNREPRFAHLIHQAHRSVFRAVDRELRAALDISSAQLGVLYFLNSQPDCTLSALSEGLMLNNSAITGLIGRMREAGLVERRPLAGDRRTTRVALTEHGRATMQAANPMLDRFNATLRAGFTAAEQDTVRRFLEQVVDRFSAQEDTPDER